MKSLFFKAYLKLCACVYVCVFICVHVHMTVIGGCRHQISLKLARGMCAALKWVLGMETQPLQKPHMLLTAEYLFIP